MLGYKNKSHIISLNFLPTSIVPKGRIWNPLIKNKYSLKQSEYLVYIVDSRKRRKLKITISINSKTKLLHNLE